ncbi:MAG: hypothetical protein IJF78_11100 [Clostridia bacterium]|nr:hypothetical protein [Clostridia bacterium]
MNIVKFNESLEKHKTILTEQQYRTLRGLAASGDLDGAVKGLHKLLRRYRRNGTAKNRG